MKNHNIKYGRIFVILVMSICLIGIGKIGIRNEFESVKLNNKNMNPTAVSIETANNEVLIPGGMPVGIYLETDGVMILGTDKIKSIDGLTYEPALHLVKSGDYIIGINGNPIQNKKDVTQVITNLSKEDVVLKVRRNEEEIDVKLKAIEYEEHKYRMGIWIRDNVQGLGTITFLDSASRFGALGHGINDIDTNELIQIASGKLYETSISSIRKGEDGAPGGMEGIIVYNNYNLLGNITKNTNAGIYGTIDEIGNLFANQEAISIGHTQDIQTGKATIRCFVEGKLKDYEIVIHEVNREEPEINKGLVIEVVDDELLNITGGIVQGMSGSPIIQGNKIVGAVTHVFVKDSKKGYGIFIDNMIKNVE